MSAAYDALGIGCAGIVLASEVTERDWEYALSQLTTDGGPEEELIALEEEEEALAW